MDTQRNGSFWGSLPGVLTGIAAVIGASTALYLAFRDGPSEPVIDRTGESGQTTTTGEGSPGAAENSTGTGQVDVGKALGACNNEDDLSRLCDASFRWGEFIDACDEKHGSESAGVSACLQTNPSGRPGLSRPCADCFGEQLQCIRDKCIEGGGQVCRPPISDKKACNECRFYNCDIPATECKVAQSNPMTAIIEICDARN